MSGIFGVVAEFNPFHNGHAHLAQEARGMGASHIVAVMSGNFVQRADAAVTDRRIRAEAALLCGYDLVLELPLAHATATARKFADGAVRLLMETGIVETLCFGSECGDAGLLQELAAVLDDAQVTEQMRAHLSSGMTFARARQLAVEQYFPRLTGLLSGANNILAVEYLRACRDLGWNVRVVTIPRAGVSHDDAAPSGVWASASFLRGRADDLSALRRHVPPQAFSVYRKALKEGLYPADFSRIKTAVISHLRRMAPEEFFALPDVSEGIDRRLYRAVRAGCSWEEIAALTKSKRFTHARIRRLMLSAFLGVRADDADAPPPYIRILGFNRNGVEPVSAMKRRCRLPVHHSLAKLERVSAECAHFAALEARAGDLYALTLPRPVACGYEYTASARFVKYSQTD